MTEPVYGIAYRVATIWPAIDTKSTRSPRLCGAVHAASTQLLIPARTKLNKALEQERAADENTANRLDCQRQLDGLLQFWSRLAFHRNGLRSHET